MNDRGIILLYGKSGSGKDYLCNTLGLTKVVSYTTRPKRRGEISGVHHYFTTIEAAKSMIPAAVASTTFHGNYYWATSDEVFVKDVYIIDFQGIKSFESNMAGRISYRIVTVEAPWYRRLYRMLKREASPWNIHTIRKVISRLIHDRKKFPRITDSPVIRT